MPPKYFERINIGEELENRILELAQSTKQDKGTVLEGLLSLIVHDIDAYLINNMNGKNVTKDLFEDPSRRTYVRASLPENVEVRYAHLSSNAANQARLTLRIGSNETHVDDIKREILELMKQTSDKYAWIATHS